MRKNIMGKNLRQSIRRSLGRYLAIIGIIALGASIFVGLRTTKTDMIATGQAYMDEQNMFDLRLLSSYGWSKDAVDTVASLDGVECAEGIYSLDALATRGSVESVYKLYSIPDTINRVYLCGGRMPQSPEECLVDAERAAGTALGTSVTISESNDEATLQSLKYHTFTVVGYINSPLYMDESRGNTSLGNGTVSSFLYLPKDSFNLDYYTEIDITISGDYRVYTSAYNDAMDAAADALEPQLMPLAQTRYDSMRSDAEQDYADALGEYEDGLLDYETGKKEAEKELSDALAKLQDSERELDANTKQLDDGALALQQAQETLNDSALALASARAELADAKAEAYRQMADANAELTENYRTVTAAMRQIDDGLNQIAVGLAQLDSGIAQLEAGLQQLDITLRIAQTGLDVLNVAIESAQAALDQAKQDGTLDVDTIAALEQRLEELKARAAGYHEQIDQLLSDRDTYTAQLAQLKQQRADVLAQQAELESQKQTLTAALDTIDDGFLALESSRQEAESQFAEALAQIESGDAQLSAGQIELNRKLAELEEGKQALAQAQLDLEKGWEEYRSGKLQADRELSQAQLQLCDASAQLLQARKTIDAFSSPEVFALPRTTNIGYLSVDSNSDIVAGVAKVFPAFFLLIAALVCITTMTRMVEEERTQIGTLKALGYSNTSIIGKYLAYAGSAALIGCTIGVAAGSVVFPIILWNAYSLILSLTPRILLSIDFSLCIPVVLAYTAVTLLVTWYSCRMALREAPAELIRPKAPTSGKKLLLERLPFWDKLGFLNKVMVRNIFRYRQRLLMMLVGIGGCTALLLTGFGVGDSIKNIVSIQFDEVTRYDIEVRFADEMDTAAQTEFRTQIGRYVDQIGFFYQSSAELDFADGTKSVTLVAADESITDFIDFHSGDTPLTLPKEGEAMLSVGIAEKMGIHVGDTITVRTTDMRALNLRVGEIFDNHVYNYAFVSPQTIAAQWGSAPFSSVAFVNVTSEQDAHYAATHISDFDGVMNVTINQDLADQVSKMLEAMDLVVVTVVICAGLLAIIVLYNLTNINITERLREIATLKVLGFNEFESAAYVFKENLLLTAMGAILGLLGGRLLLEFVMSQIQVDIVWFEARLLPISFVLSIVLTFLSALLVDFILYFKLDKINMAEALKSVE